MLIYAAILQCTDPVLTVAAAVSYGRTVFLSPESARAEANAARKEIIGESLAAKSDHLATVHAFASFLQARADLGDRGAQQWCRDSFLSYDAMLGIRDGRCELVNSLLETGFVNQGVVPICTKLSNLCHWWISVPTAVPQASTFVGFNYDLCRLCSPRAKWGIH